MKKHGVEEKEDSGRGRGGGREGKEAQRTITETSHTTKDPANVLIAASNLVPILLALGTCRAAHLHPGTIGALGEATIGFALVGTSTAGTAGITGTGIITIRRSIVAIRRTVITVVV